MAISTPSARTRYRPQSSSAPITDSVPSDSGNDAAQANDARGGEQQDSEGIQLGSPTPAVGNTYQGGIYNTSSPGQMAQQNRMQAAGTGQAIIDNSVNSQNRYTQNEQQYQQAANEAYGQLAANPGYNPDLEKQINQDYGQYRTSAEALGQQFLSPTEQAQISGNPYVSMSYLNPEKLEGMQGQYQDQAMNAVGRLKQGLNDAIDPSVLKQSQSYQNSVTGATGALNAAANDSANTIDPSFAARQMSDADVQEMKTAAGTNVGNRYRSSMDEINRNAAASGLSAGATADSMERMNRASAVDSADAMTNADIAAKQAQFGRAQSIEQQRAAEQQYATGAKMSAAATGAGLAGQEESMRQAGEQYLTGAKMGAAATGGQAEINQSNTGYQNFSNAEQFNQQMGASYAKAAEQAASDRAGTIAANRQATTQNVENTAYNQGVQTAQATSQGAQTVGNAQISGQNAYRNFLTGEQGAAQTGATTAAGQQIQGAQVQNQGMAAAANTAVANNTSPSAGQQLGMQILSMFEDGTPGQNGDTLAVVGENGPEYVGAADALAGASQPPAMENGGVAGSGLPTMSGYTPPQVSADAGGTPPSLVQRYKQNSLSDTMKSVKQVYNRYKDSRAGQGGAEAAQDATSDAGTMGGEAAGMAAELMQFGRIPKSTGGAGGKIVSKPTLALLKKNEVVVPLNPKHGARVPPIMQAKAREAAIHAAERERGPVKRYRPPMGVAYAG